MKYMLLFLMVTVVSFAQNNVNYASIDKKMDAIPENFTKSTDSIALYINNNFKTEDDKVRATFYWIASNITYDKENLFVVKFKETRKERIVNTLKTKKGICRDFANIFSDIANAAGVKALVVSGYTKTNGKIHDLSHAWCAAKIDSKWYLFDPTWGRLYNRIDNKNVIRKTTNSFFKTEPELLIKSHMPFDYLWQLIDYPITNQEFIEGVIAIDETKTKFDFAKEIARYEALSKADQFFESAQRIEKNGIKNQFISKAYLRAMNQWNYEKDKEIKFKMSAVSEQFNLADGDLSAFINYRNRKFQPLASDKEIKRQIQGPRDTLVKCETTIRQIRNSTDNYRTNLEILENKISRALTLAEKQLQFVNLYLSKPKSARKTMFYTVKKSLK